MCRCERARQQGAPSALASPETIVWDRPLLYRHRCVARAFILENCSVCDCCSLLLRGPRERSFLYARQVPQSSGGNCYTAVSPRTQEMEGKRERRREMPAGTRSRIYARCNTCNTLGHNRSSGRTFKQLTPLIPSRAGPFLLLSREKSVRVALFDERVGARSSSEASTRAFTPPEGRQGR